MGFSTPFVSDQPKLQSIQWQLIDDPIAPLNPFVVRRPLHCHSRANLNHPATPYIITVKRNFHESCCVEKKLNTKQCRH